MKKEIGWMERLVEVGMGNMDWEACILSECHPGDLVRVCSSDGPGEPFIYAEPEPLEHNVGAVPPVDERSALEMRLDADKRALSLKLTAFSPHRHSPAACPWCGEPFGSAWEMRAIFMNIPHGWSERLRSSAVIRPLGDPHTTTCPRCGWIGTFVRTT
ncbi:MAG: hypothetical protein PHX83_06745 [Acidobacteriia bacterium]|nr:hypothetical protein [Terriglobia bacterium]